MRILILGDIHANLPAFEFVLESEKNIDRKIILGDLINYGPWNNECAELARTLQNCTYILGNHEKYFINKNTREIKNILVKKFYQHCVKDFKYIDFLKKFKIKAKIDNYIYKHTIFNKYIFPETKVKILNNYVIGHSQIQFKKKIGNKFIINPGSVGQNRKNLNIIEYAIYDTEKKFFIMKKKFFENKFIINEMKKKKFPTECIDYYRKKIKG